MDSIFSRLGFGRRGRASGVSPAVPPPTLAARAPASSAFHFPGTLALPLGGAVSVMDQVRADYQHANFPCEIGSSNGPGTPGNAILENVFDPTPLEGRQFPRISGYLKTIQGIKDWVLRFGREPTKVEIIVSHREHIKETRSEGHQVWLRFNESTCPEGQPAYGTQLKKEPSTHNQRVAADFTKRGAPTRVGLMTSTGLILQISERIYAFEGNEHSVPNNNLQYLADKQEHERQMEGCERGKATYTMAIGKHTLPDIVTQNFLEFQSWNVVPDQRNPVYRKRLRSERSRLKVPPSVDNLKAEESIAANEVASRGYKMPDGTVWRMIDYVGPKSGGTNLNTQERAMRFLEHVTDVCERHKVTKILNVAFNRVWGSHDKEAGLEGHSEGRSFLFSTLMRCQERGDGEYVPPPPPPRDAITVQEVMADESLEAQQRLERGVVNNFGEGFAILEYFSGEFNKGNLSFEQQQDEFLRRLGGWMYKYPDREIQETRYSMAEARFLGPREHGYRRRIVIRFKEKNFDPSMATTEGPKDEVITVRDADSAQLRSENKAAFEGVEWDKNRGMALVHFFAPPPYPGEIGTKEGAYRSLLLLNDWSNRHPDRRIVEFSNIFRWDHIATPNDPANSFEHSYLLRFEPR